MHEDAYKRLQAQALLHACSTCDADPGEECISTLNGRPQRPHSGRRQAALEARRELVGGGL